MVEDGVSRSVTRGPAPVSTLWQRGSTLGHGPLPGTLRYCETKPAMASCEIPLRQRLLPDFGDLRIEDRGKVLGSRRAPSGDCYQPCGERRGGVGLDLIW